jgi:phosphopantetheinyl transferase (holo-ACP synthase)
MQMRELPEDDVTLLWCLDYVLNPSELRYLERFFKNNQRRREWILGRIAAKEAVRLLAKRLSNFDLCAADIVIVSDGNGKPWVQGEFVNDLGWSPLLSITHKNDSVLAFAAHPQIGLNIGVDMEQIVERESGFEMLALTTREQNILETTPIEKRNELLALIWAAKEAAGKASGLGLRNNPKSIEIISAAHDSAQVQATLLQTENSAFDTDTLNSRMVIHLERLENLIIAVTTLQPALAVVGK